MPHAPQGQAHVLDAAVLLSSEVRAGAASAAAAAGASTSACTGCVAADRQHGSTAARQGQGQ